MASLSLTVSTVKPLADRVFVKVSASEEKTAGGILLPDTAKEKPQIGEGWINGAFFVMEPQIFDYIDNDLTQFEKEPLEQLAREGQLMAYKHEGFWQCMDTLREKHLLNELWNSGKAPWKIWE